MDDKKISESARIYKTEKKEFNGPLRIHPSNPRYFTDDSGRAIYLTGSHTWNNFIDSGNEYSIEPFDFDNYLDFLRTHGHNFIRLWRWELPRSYYENKISIASPFPWSRTGPGLASDGKAKFDLLEFNQAYFDRLRERVIKAGDKGIYVSIMLFEGWGLQFCRSSQDGFPFDAGNNVNEINSPETSSHTIESLDVLSIQEKYIIKTIDTVNDLDNVLYEVANEDGGGSLEWHYYIIEFVNKYQSTKAKRHPMGMTYRYKGGTNKELFESAADWISPGRPDPDSNFSPYRNDPPASDGKKIIITDTDHLWGIGGDHQWVWKSFLRGLNPIYMDPFKSANAEYRDERMQRNIESARKSMGQTLLYSRKINLSSMTPWNELSSTNYCLANPGEEYLIYLPSRGHRGMKWFDRFDLHKYLGWGAGIMGWKETVTVNLSGYSGKFKVEWLNPRTGEIIEGKEVDGGGQEILTSSFTGDVVLYICKKVLWNS